MWDQPSKGSLKGRRKGLVMPSVARSVQGPWPGTTEMARGAGAEGWEEAEASWPEAEGTAEAEGAAEAEAAAAAESRGRSFLRMLFISRS